MKHFRPFLIIFSMYVQLIATPFIDEIENQTSFVYEIKDHSTVSSCGLFKNEIQLYQIHPDCSYTEPIILDQGDCLTLLPVAYFDERLNDYIWFIDRNGNRIEKQITEAYEAWRFGIPSRQNISQDEWMYDWVGSEIVVTIKESIHGYMLHMLHGITANNTHIDHAWLQHSQGAYSALSIDIKIMQFQNGIKPEIYVTNSSRGAVCEDNKVIRL
jgi:hypothetical protein